MSRELFFTAVDAAERVLASDALRAQWDQASALDEYTVGGLAGHLSRATLTVAQYLDIPAPPDGTPTLDAGGYFAAVLGDHDPVDSDFHRAVRTRSAKSSADGPDALADSFRDLRKRLAERLDDATLGRLIAVKDGVAMTVADYLETRLVELVVHLDDLAVSLGEDGPDGLPQEAYDLVAGVLARIASRRVGGLATVRSLSRRERHPDAVRAF